MNSIRRAAARSTQHHLTQPARRYASHGSEHSAHAAHTESTKEGFGMGFYLGFGAPILFYVVYQFSKAKDGSIPFITDLIGQYTRKQEEDQRRMTLHMAASDQAAFDRHLFTTATKAGRSAGIDLRYPEVFNTGSPHNVQAGQGNADVSKLMAHYQEKAEKAEAERVAKYER